MATRKQAAAPETTANAEAAPPVKKPRASAKKAVAPVVVPVDPAIVVKKPVVKKAAAKKVAADTVTPVQPPANPIVTTLNPRAAWPFPTGTKP